MYIIYNTNCINGNLIDQLREQGHLCFDDTEFGIRDNVPNTDGIRDIFFCIRDIVLDIWKYELLGTMSLIPKIFSGIYIQIGIDWNQFPAGKRIDSD